MNDGFKFFKLSVAARLVLAGVFFAAAVVVQFFSTSFLAGLPCFILAWLVLAVKTVTNKPDDQGLEEWKPVTMKEVDRLYDNLRKSKEFKKVRSLKAGCPAMIIFLNVGIFVLVFLAGPARALFGSGGSKNFFWLVGDIVLMFIPAIFFGNLRVFVPAGLDMKASSFYVLLSETLPPGMVYTPYLRFDKDSKGRPVPEDIRLMLELKRKPDDFMGVQFQIAINNGPHGAVPYMYAVILTKGKAESYRKILAGKSKLSHAVSGYIIEEGGDKDYGTVVIRQNTSGGGYHTDESDIRSLRDAVLKCVHYLQAA
ncbi:MAG: hypothetical protein JW874_00055 [Spirochaetales bacterium]|nr:hypothetical protein [Spirochaetales bacterium]